MIETVITRYSIELAGNNQDAICQYEDGMKDEQY
jgi:hypothetical protein